MKGEKGMRKVWLAIVAVMVAIVLVLFVPKDVEGKTNNIIERIPLEEMIKHDTEVAYQKWIETQKPVETSYIIDVTEEDIDLMARVVMSEGSILPLEGKQLIASTIICRVLDGRWGDTVNEVVNYPNAYSTQDNGDPTTDCYFAVYEELKREVFPNDLFYFRTNKPHSFGYEYAHIGNTYFSTEGEIK